LPLEGRTDFQWWDYADVMPGGCKGVCPFAGDFPQLRFDD
jgi:hypothetical protein